MKDAIVGYTGFVGQNLCLSRKFDNKYNSKNIQDAYDTNPELLVYAGIRAEMFTANHYPEQDFTNIKEAIENIRKISPKKLVLISTISVYPVFEGDENTVLDENDGTTYGRNRRYLEKWVEENIKDYLIVRLPALYGRGIKKNFIYDIIHYIPGLLKTSKYEELFNNSSLARLYQDRGDGFYKCIAETKDDKKALRAFFEKSGFSALNFTDSRSEYQYFSLANLWNVINIALENNLHLLTIATEPILSSELYEYIYDQPFKNEVSMSYPVEHLKSIHAEVFGGKDGFLYNKKQLLEDIKCFINEQMRHD